MRISDWSSDVCSSDLLPLQEDRLGLRVSYARNELPGYTDNAVDGREDINGGSQTGARAALVWDGDAFDLKLAALHQGIDSDNTATVAPDPATDIGSASCRKRGRQYV